jgi:hypothetical protein
MTCSVNRFSAIFVAMALHSELPVYKASYDLMLTVFQFVKDFSREYKYSVGDALKNETMGLMTLLFRANSRTDRESVLQEARERVEVIRLYVRLMHDLHQVSVKRFVHLNMRVETVSKQLAGWHAASKRHTKAAAVP